ncbi:hypothetical protein BACCIP111895_03220 [Neobacillus rhizosphaerae]|uniref:Uncharacterized protein n=1 Tax=Neobacillus rhizosphaerae TaxID=2880965 RepID=A0ABM9EV63_9BACI|nr:hypothetical protein [Neobacillus rhizosphaerae]CAH2716036.1 hypothetical protein BACCIP111895_03220 [Neobacillus rhizosphaerae]
MQFLFEIIVEFIVEVVFEGFFHFLGSVFKFIKRFFQKLFKILPGKLNEHFLHNITPVHRNGGFFVPLFFKRLVLWN